MDMTAADFEKRIASYDTLIERIDELLREANTTPASLDETSEFLVQRGFAEVSSGERKSRWLYSAAGLAMVGGLLLAAAIWLTSNRGKLSK